MDDQSKALSSRGIVDSGTMRSLVRAQEATGKAHVTIQVTAVQALPAHCTWSISTACFTCFANSAYIASITRDISQPCCTSCRVLYAINPYYSK